VTGASQGFDSLFGIFAQSRRAVVGAARLSAVALIHAKKHMVSIEIHGDRQPPNDCSLS
jgi:hypothetical protein